MTTKSFFNKSALLLAGVVLTTGGNAMADQDQRRQAELDAHVKRLDQQTVNLDGLKDAEAGKPLSDLAKKACAPTVRALADSAFAKENNTLSAALEGKTVDPTGLDAAQARTRASVQQKCIAPKAQ